MLGGGVNGWVVVILCVFWSYLFCGPGLVWVGGGMLSCGGDVMEVAFFCLGLVFLWVFVWAG